jgi:HK97 family phage major capsid protein
MNRTSFGFFRKLKDSDDRYLWSNNLAAGQPPTLAGFPVVEVQGMPDIAADANAVAFANMRVAYTIVDRIGLRTLRDPYSAKPYVLFDWTKRTGGDLLNTEAIKLLRFATA